ASIEFEVPVLLTPARRETLADYARRMCDHLDLAGPVILGGISFGGMLAYEMARFCDAKCVIMIASCRSRAALPSYYRAVEWVSRIIPDSVAQRRTIISGQFFTRFERLNDQQRDIVTQMSRDVAMPLLRGVGRMIVSWQASAEPPCPVYHIHGDGDRIIPLGQMRPDEVVVGGGHLINLTHAEQVNAFIGRHIMACCPNGRPCL
ncbi:MAG: alpha/beta hydrolase, partial [Phycisphaerae bacterium]|nr:alpha/beta hydrolase [Phycisphaerae bacterium]